MSGWTAAAVVGGAVIGGVASNMAADTAADAQRDAAGRQIAAEDRRFNLIRQDTAPARAIGLAALRRLDILNRPGGGMVQPFNERNFRADPGYQFRMSEGLRALERGAASRTGALSGAAVKGAQRYAQGLASQEYGQAFERFQTERTNRFNRLASLAGIGQLAQGQSNDALNQSTAGITGAYGSIGNATAAGAIAQGNAIGGIGNAIGDYAMLQSLRGTPTTAPAPNPPPPPPPVRIAGYN